MDLQTLAYDYLRSFYGRFYRWGGDDPSGFDCSGLAVEFLQSFGMMPHNKDLTAQELFDLFRNKAHKPDFIRFGSLLFFGDDLGSINHVAIALGKHFLIGAEGGHRGVKTVEDAIKANAFIKIRPIKYRGEPVAVCTPLYHWIVIK